MSKLPPVKKPFLTAEEETGVDVANIILDAHNEINTAISRAVIEIAGGGAIPAALDILDKKIDGIMRMAKRAAYLRAGLTP